MASIWNLSGPLGIGEAAGLHARACELFAAGDDVEVRCAGVERVHSAALQILAALSAALATRGKRLVLRAEQPLAQALELAGLADSLPVEAS